MERLKKTRDEGVMDLGNGLLVVLAGGQDGVLGAEDVVEGGALGNAEELEGALEGHLERSRGVVCRGSGRRRGGRGREPAEGEDRRRSPPPPPPPRPEVVGRVPGGDDGGRRRRGVLAEDGAVERESRCHSFPLLFPSLSIN